MKLRCYISFLGLMFWACLFHAQPTSFIDPGQTQEVKLPVVFQIGEYESAYEQLLTEYPSMLLNVCGNDMAIAYDQWIGFLMKLEQKAEKESFDILGVKMWLNVFWDKDGNVEHVAFHLKPNSKNVSTKQLAALLKSFASESKMPVKANQPYSHYGSVAFPLFPRSISRK